MAKDYSATHSRALALVTKMGTSVTFSLDDTTVSASAVQDEGSFRQYLSQGLITQEDQVIFAVPETEGECPKEGYTLSGFSEVDFVTKKVFPISPSGTVIAFKVVVSR